jgi:2-hydroxychromene-2-carboxylate isomerase
MPKPRVRVYTDYKSPFAFVANKPLFELEQQYGVELEWLPYTLRVAEFMGSVEERTPHFWRKVRYMYMDARRHANAQGLVMKGPRHIYNGFYASAGMLFAQRKGFFRLYHDTVFCRFWSHDLEIDNLADIAGLIFIGWWLRRRIRSLCCRSCARGTRADYCRGRGAGGVRGADNGFQ